MLILSTNVTRYRRQKGISSIQIGLQLTHIIEIGSGKGESGEDEIRRDDQCSKRVFCISFNFNVVMALKVPCIMKRGGLQL